tara:strand:- start:9 stop:467 length:459 start_codon:yes stop_codon:yes gene_type:complete
MYGPISPAIWGPKYWFFIHTIAFNYPDSPSAAMKRKYYDFFMNLPLFIPDPGIGEKFTKLLDEYPVSPYLESRSSLMIWTHYIHNKVNASLGKKELSYDEALRIYLSLVSEPPTPSRSENDRRTWISCIITALLLLIMACSVDTTVLDTFCS